MSARHIVGGEITYVNVGSSLYEIQLTLFRDCDPVAKDPDSLVFLCIYKTIDGGLFDFVPVEISPIRDSIPTERWQNCTFGTRNLCIERVVYRSEIFLPPINGGYDISWAICCRTPVIVNMISGGRGLTLSVHIPGIDISGVNSSPVFNQYPPLFLCVGEELIFDYSAFDPDSDSLAYKINVPYDSKSYTGEGPSNSNYYVSANNPTGPPPYVPLNFTLGYDAENPFGIGTGTAEVESSTGKVRFKPEQLGSYLICISVDEFRNGTKIGEIRRDFLFTVLPCRPMGMAPTVSHDYGSLNLIQDTLQVQPGEAFCFQAAFSDTTADDQILTRKWGSFQAYDLIAPTLANPVEALVCWEADCESQQERFPMILYARDTADCPYYRETFDTTWVRVNAPFFAPPSPSFRFPQSTASGDTLSMYPDEQVCLEILLRDPDQSGRIDLAALEARLAADSMIHRYSVQATDSGATICLTANCGRPPYRTSIWVSVVDTGACAQTYQWRDTVWLQTRACEISFPNVFTPNQDGVNDLFRPFDIKGITVLSLKVYDRWGRRVYEDAQPPIAWNGWHANLKIAPVGVYFYVFTYQETGVLPTKIISKRGQVTLLR